MRYLVIRNKDTLPEPLVWDGEKTHLEVIKERHLRHESISSAGYVVFNRDKNDFFITWHTPYADEPDEVKDKEDRQIVLDYMRSVYGHDPIVQNKMADEFEAQQRKNEEIRKRYFSKEGR